MRISSPSNHTEQTPQQLANRMAYVVDHLVYFDYVQTLLDRAALPHSNIYQPNLTSMAAMVAELQELNPTSPWLNAVVLGRVLNRVLPRLLTWHGVSRVEGETPQRVPILLTTTAYRFCEVFKAREAFELFVGESLGWSNDYDQWQSATDSRNSQFND
jgi:hypothetical protein